VNNDPKKIIDNSDLKLYAFLYDVLKEIPGTQFDIATAFFKIQVYAFIKENIQAVKGYRLLLGKAPDIRSETTLNPFAGFCRIKNSLKT